MSAAATAHIGTCCRGSHAAVVWQNFAYGVPVSLLCRTRVLNSEEHTHLHHRDVLYWTQTTKHGFASPHASISSDLPERARLTAAATGSTPTTPWRRTRRLSRSLLVQAGASTNYASRVPSQADGQDADTVVLGLERRVEAGLMDGDAPQLLSHLQAHAF